MSEQFRLHDEPTAWPVVSSSVAHESPIACVRVDEVTVPDGGQPFRRDVLEHPGAVAVLALDTTDRVLLIRQYRHAAGAELVEIPAGLRDAAGESTLDTARRELREEGFAEADEWTSLFEVFPSPGLSAERVEVFWAQNARTVGADPSFVLEHEEAHMTRAWVPFEEALDAALHGRLSNGITVTALCALAARRSREQS